MHVSQELATAGCCVKLKNGAASQIGMPRVRSVTFSVSSENEATRFENMVAAQLGGFCELIACPAPFQPRCRTASVSSHVESAISFVSGFQMPTQVMSTTTNVHIAMAKPTGTQEVHQSIQRGATSPQRGSRSEGNGADPGSDDNNSEEGSGNGDPSAPQTTDSQGMTDVDQNSGTKYVAWYNPKESGIEMTEEEFEDIPNNRDFKLLSEGCLGRDSERLLEQLVCGFHNVFVQKVTKSVRCTK